MVKRAVLLVALLCLAPPGVAAAQTSGGTQLFDESFKDSKITNPNFVVGGTVNTDDRPACLTARSVRTPSPGQPIPGCPANDTGLPTPDPEGSGALRLTSNQDNATGFIIYKDALPFTAGIDLSFQFYAYHARSTSTGFGADGITFFLANGANDIVKPGAFGGSIGYAQRNTPLKQDGLLGGYAGLGFDEWGNYGNNQEGRGQGCNQPDTGFYKDYITLRGPGSGQQKYCIVDRKQLGGGKSIDNPSALQRDAPDTKRWVHVRVDPLSDPSPHISAEISFDGTSYTKVFDAPLPANPPPTFKFGLASGTGGANNIHEVTATKIYSIEPLPRMAIAKSVKPDPSVTGGSTTFTLSPRTLTQEQAGSPVGDATTPITVTDDIPAGGGSVAAAPSGSGWDCSTTVVGSRHVTCTRDASSTAPIAPGTVLPQITVPVSFTLNESGKFVNVAEINSQDNASTPEQRTAREPYTVLPKGEDDAATTDIGVPVGIPILDNDHGSLVSSTVTITDAPNHGTVAWDDNAQQALYTPDPGWSGIDTFRYEVLDESGQPVRQKVTITVPPYANDDYASTQENTPVTIDMLANDLGNLQPDTVEVVIPPSHGKVVIDPKTGEGRYTPDKGFTGQDSYVYSVRDGSGQLTQATVVIDVYAGPKPPEPPPKPPDPPKPNPPLPRPGTPPGWAPRVRSANLEIVKTVAPKNASVGDVVAYRVVVHNRGPGPAVDVVTTDNAQLPLRYLRVRPSAGTCTSRAPITCHLGVIRPGGTVTIRILARPLAAGHMVNRASVTTPTPGKAPAQGVASLYVSSARLVLTKQASVSRVRPGRRVTFRIHVRNTGRGTAREVQVCDRLPADLRLTAAPGARRHGDRLCWAPRTLKAHAQRTYLLHARARAVARTHLAVNRALATGHRLRARRARARVLIEAPPKPPPPKFTG